MKGLTGLLIVVIILMAPIRAYAAPASIEWETLSDMSDRIYQLVDNQNYTMAQEILEDFYNKWKMYEAEHSNLQQTTVRATNASIEKLQKALSSPDFEPTVKRQAAVEFRLIVNAISKDSTPMWLMFKDELTGHLEALTQALEANDFTLYQRELNQFIDLYYMLYPALIIDVEPEQMKTVDAAVQNLVANRTQLNSETEKNLSQLAEKMTYLVNHFPLGARAKTSIAWTMLSVGGLIICTLIYVAWKKYRAQVQGRFGYPRF